MRNSETSKARLGRKGLYISGAIGGAAILGLLLVNGTLAAVAASGGTTSAPAQSLTVGDAPTSLAAGAFQGFWVPCTLTGHCAANVAYHNAVVTMTMATNSSNLTMFYFFGASGASAPALTAAHGALVFGTHGDTTTYSGYYAEFYNPHSFPVTYTVSFVAIFENLGS